MHRENPQRWTVINSYTAEMMSPCDESTDAADM